MTGGSATGGSGPVLRGDWPGPSAVAPLEDPALFDANLSGLTYSAAAANVPAQLWAVSNIPGMLYRLVPGGSGFVVDAAFGSGKLLRYPNGAGEADAEGVTLGPTAADGVYVVAEHDNDAADVSRISVLRYDASESGAALTATHEWDVTALMPDFGANLGAEAVTWVADDYLVERGFFDESAGHDYAPSDYPEHGGGVFFLGVEQTGGLYGFVLDHEGGGATLVANVVTRFPGVMGLEFDRDVGQLWAWCDEVCSNQASVLDIDSAAGSATQGRFVERFWLQHPAGLPNSNNEGIAIGAESECRDGVKPFFWTDDNDVDGQSLRQGAVRCAGAL
jgi:hypothetical protein